MNQATFFKDLIVVELASVLAGPAVGMFFAELGAKVIKIENKKTGGDVTRSWKLPQETAANERSAYFDSVNWQKEHLLLDLTVAQDLNLTKQWITKADVVITNFKAGSDQKLGLDYAAVQQLNPQIIFASISAYGEQNPSPGFDAMIQAETGWVYMNGEPSGQPVKMPVALMDILSAHQLKQAILLALLHRMKTGQGSKVHVSLFDTGVCSLANQASNWLNLGVLPKRKGSQHPNIAPYGDVFQTKDSRLIMLGTGTQKQFEGLCHCLELSALISDERFLTNALRVANRAALNVYLKAAFEQLIFDDLWARCQAQNVTLSPINSLKEVFERPAAQALILEQEHENGQVSKRVKTIAFKLEAY